MADEARRADQRLRLAIVVCLIGGPLVTLSSLWYLSQPFGVRKGTVGGIFLGVGMFALGLYELRHRIRLGPQQLGRRMKRPDA
ncbi:hypothetical protein F0U44_11220 [Nocardioides humilatus]|uniref:Uncharacterized protein n=1 Tax=Nocardioides humilatus TaxID=2607660 RepID=A0A5B1LEZ8_9ACTN|nr:hypothetical protein [Nocardioides humilatus]KAA1419026.1 hypothetical protein F0U44_11220 [Nocardioides humilatus]